MAEEQKPIAVEAPKIVEETPAPVIAEPAKEEAAAPAATTEVAAPAPAVESADDKPAEAAATEEAKPEEVKEEVKPIEEGHLSHKAQGLSFPKNLIPTKEFFFFGTDAFEAKTLAAYQRSEKSAETAQSNIAWASETGNGLLFIGEKKNPTGLINLSDATEPVVEGTHKFTLTSKGNKHSFKAASTAERDNWVAQLKHKIAEAKELATTVVETENYKKTIDSFKPAVPAKDEKPVEAPKEEVKPVEEAPKAEETPVVEEAKLEEKAESPKPSKSKRASFFDFLKKDEPKEEKKEVKAEEAKPAEETKTEEIVAPVPAEEDKPVEEAPKVEETPAAPEAVAIPAETPKEEEKLAEEVKPAESPKEKANKRNSFFGSVFSKKEKKAVETKPAEATEAPKEEEVPATTETAPVIPPVESTTPLAVDVSTPATVPTETTEVAPASGEIKKDPKEKRKSSLPFLGKREKSPSPANGEERSKSPFSKLRATIRGKTASKTEDKPAEEAAKEETVKEEAAEIKPVEEPVKEEPVKPVEPEAETKPENVAATTTPVVTAAA